MATLTPRAEPRSLIVHHATAVDAKGTTPDSWIYVCDGVIQQIGSGETWTRRSADVVIDSDGGYLTPGFIDLHFHGGGGHSNEDGSSAIMSALSAHHAHGTTRAVVSFVANPVDVLRENLLIVAKLTEDSPTVLGSHLEGPFLSEDRKGAHNADHLIDPTPPNLETILKAARGTLRQITIDPEREDSHEAIRAFVRAGVVVAIGHTNADYSASTEAFASGASLLTHSFNAMPGIHHRAPGPIVAAIDCPGAVLELILDGEHVHPRVAALLFGAAPHRVALITDAMAAGGVTASDGCYPMGDARVVVANDRAVLEGTNTLAGSTLTLDRALRVGLSSGIPVQVLVEALTLTPARVLRLDHKLGVLSPGYEADLVLFDRSWQVQKTFVQGRALN